MVAMPAMLHLTLVIGTAAVTCPEHPNVWQSESLRIWKDTECAEGQFCARVMSFLDKGRQALEQKCTDNPYQAGNSYVSVKYEASVGSCCRQSVNSLASQTRVILFDANPGVLTNTTERNAFIDQYDAQDYTECPCMCKYDPSKSSRRRQWWGGYGRRRRSGVRSGEEAAAVAAQANCPFAAEHENTQAATQISSSSGSKSSGSSLSGSASNNEGSTDTAVSVVVSSTFTFGLPDAAVTVVIDDERVRSAFITAFKTDIGAKLGLGRTESSKRIEVTALRRGSLLVDFTVTSSSSSSTKVTDEVFAEQMTGDISLDELSSNVILANGGVSVPASVPASNATMPQAATTSQDGEFSSSSFFLRPCTLAVAAILSAMLGTLSVQ